MDGRGAESELKGKEGRAVSLPAASISMLVEE